MLCPKCENQIKDGDKFCEKCGVAVEETVATEEIRSEETISDNDVVEETKISEKTASSVEPSVEKKDKVSKPKSKKKTVIISVIAAVLAAVAVCSVFLWEYIENTAVKTFSSPTSYYHYVETKNISTISKSAGRFVKMVNGSANGDFGTSGEFKILLGDILIDKIATETGIDKQNISWLSEAGIRMDTAMTGNLSSAKGDITLNGKTILGMELIFDSEDYCCYLRCPQLNQQYALIDFSAINDLNMQIPQVSIDWDNMPDDETVEQLIEKYLTIAIESFDDVSEISDTVTANGVSQNCTRLTVKINENSLKKVVKAVLREVKTDKDIEEIIKNIAEMSGETDVNETYSAFVESVNAALDKIDETPIDEFEFKIISWVDSKGDVIGREIDFGNMLGSSDFNFRYATTHDGTDVGIETVVGNSEGLFKVLGKGKINGTKMNGDLKIIFNDKEYFNVNIKNYDIDLIEDNYVNGIFTITVSKDFCDMLADELGISQKDAESLQKCALRLEVESSEKSGIVSASILYEEKLVIGVSTSSKQTNINKVTLPESYAKLDSDTEIQNYLSAFDTDKLLQSLKDAGMPESLLDSLSDMGSGGFADDPDYGYDEDYGIDEDYGFDDDLGLEDDYDFGDGNGIDDFMTDDLDAMF